MLFRSASLVKASDKNSSPTRQARCVFGAGALHHNGGATGINDLVARGRARILQHGAVHKARTPPASYLQAARQRSRAHVHGAASAPTALAPSLAGTGLVAGDRPSKHRAACCPAVQLLQQPLMGAKPVPEASKIMGLSESRAGKSCHRAFDAQDFFFSSRQTHGR